jgi:hypothetical protein
MKKFILSAAAIFGVVFSAQAQLIVDAEMFKSNPNQFLGKTVTIKNVTLKEASCHKPGPVAGAVSAPAGSAGVGSPAPVGIAGPNSGKSASIYCSPQPNMTLTKWSIGPNNDLCVQIDARMKPALDAIPTGKVAKSITFRVTPTMYTATRIEP